MAILAAADELWRPEDGAPGGPEFDVLVPSSSQPGLEYRIARDAVAVVYHVPRCTAWKYGHRSCAHLRRAVELSEDPAWTFVADVIAAWNAGGWDPRKRAEFGAAVFNGAQAALRQRAELERQAEDAKRPPVDGAQALAKWGARP